MKIGIFDPYLDSFGGGERYCLTLASHWSKLHEVNIFWDDPTLSNRTATRLKIDLSGVKVVKNFFKEKNILKRIFLTTKYDLIFFLSDGSIPTSLAKYNILHFQVPFQNIKVPTFKLSRFQKVVCNSLFTQKFINPGFKPKTVIIYPPVLSIDSGKDITKKKMILNVGRFTGYFQAKKQEILIETFAKMVKREEFSKWKMVLAGGLLKSDQDYFRELIVKSHGLPIEILPNVSYEELIRLYQDATLYWHAAGYGETKPELMEHFGISTVEAMSAGCVPIVYDGGGQKEIISEGMNGFLWHTPSELMIKSAAIINKSSLSKLQKECRKRSTKFSQKVFCQAFDRLLDEIIDE